MNVEEKTSNKVNQNKYLSMWTSEKDMMKASEYANLLRTKYGFLCSNTQSLNELLSFYRSTFETRIHNKLGRTEIHISAKQGHNYADLIETFRTGDSTFTLHNFENESSQKKEKFKVINRFLWQCK